MTDLLDVQADSGRIYMVNPYQIQSVSRVRETTVVTLADGTSISTPEYDTSLLARIREIPKLQVRYIVRDVDAAIQFYVQNLEFKLDQRPSPTVAMLLRGGLRLVLNGPGSTEGGRTPEPGGWNRFSIQVDNIETTVARLRKAGVSFRCDIVAGVGARQILLDDPSGNPVELFQPLAA